VTVEVPSDSARTRSIIIAVAVVVALVLVAGGVWAVISSGEDGPAKQTAIEPAEQTTATPLPPAPGAGTTGSAEPSAATPVPGTPSPTPSGQPSSAKVAFRLGASIYVANEDGSGAVAVATSSENYALSPDSKTLAVVPGTLEQGVSGAVTLIDVASGAQRAIGAQAVSVAPQWAPDSTWLAYTGREGDTFLAKGVGADGARDTVLAKPGARPAVSSDGGVIAYKQANLPGLGDPLMVHVAAEKKPQSVRNGEGALSWGWGPGSVLYFTRPGSAEGKWELWSWKRGSSARRAGTLTLAVPAYALDDVTASADGRWVVVTATGDDDYSRLWVFDVGEKRFSAITTRRDAYPYRWTSDGRLMYFEGNVYQGEPSALMSILPDGSERRMIVSGAQP